MIDRHTHLNVIINLNTYYVIPLTSTNNSKTSIIETSNYCNFNFYIKFSNFNSSYKDTIKPLHKDFA